MLAQVTTAFRRARRRSSLSAPPSAEVTRNVFFTTALGVVTLACGGVWAVRVRVAHGGGVEQASHEV